MLFFWNRSNFPAADTQCCLAKPCWEINFLRLPSLPQDKTPNCSIFHLPKANLSIQQPTFKKEGQWFIQPCWGSQWGLHMPAKPRNRKRVPGLKRKPHLHSCCFSCYFAFKETKSWRGLQHSTARHTKMIKHLPLVFPLLETLFYMLPL